ARQVRDRRRRGAVGSDGGRPADRGHEQPRRADRKRAQQSNEPWPEHRRHYTFSSASGYTVRARATCPQHGARPVPSVMPERHFVKYTFLRVDPAWRRLDVEERRRDKREFLAACEDFAQVDGHLLRSFSLIGT